MKELTKEQADKEFNEHIKQYFRITIPDKPFSGMPIQWRVKDLPPDEGYREPLTNNELLLLKAAVPELSQTRLEAVLRRCYAIGDDRIKTLTWAKIGIFCSDLLDSQGTQARKPPKVKEPSRESRIAYQLITVSGFTQEKAAETMERELQKPVKQYQISRWIKKYVDWLEINKLPLDAKKQKVKVQYFDPDFLDMGKRTDPRAARANYDKNPDDD